MRFPTKAKCLDFENDQASFSCLRAEACFYRSQLWLTKLEHHLDVHEAYFGGPELGEYSASNCRVEFIQQVQAHLRV